jgi:hypothetical protein
MQVPGRDIGDPDRQAIGTDHGLHVPAGSTVFAGSSILTGQPEVGTRAARLNLGGP